MLGIVFSEFTEMVEEVFSADMVDDILDDCDLESGGAYTAVGAYSHHEIIALVVALSKRTGMEVDDLVKAFGKHLATVFSERYPVFFTSVDNSFDFFKSVDGHIHKEVLKLYPNATLPKFTYEEPDENTLVMHYSSVRPFSVLAKGLIEGTLDYFGEEASVDCVNHSTEDENKVEFTIRRTSAA
ncbi:Heme NO binding domain protein [Candidatus Terasakiella magnetica]|uniref:Heme NO binding domain protein n=1 Tax=Candidatus Terasakiella magnetica TaxID=1867952 RepID=A0A1C3RJ24_9PROT|nr:heme NO-binding domain-containing protein [Candidatus Terasakiella magnetica]SCA57263.1 Heme NO binding domain protein [Candidatus Terasakiella magnetica]